MTMSTILARVPVARPAKSTPTTPPDGPVAAPRLASDLQRLRAEEQERIDRERQEALARWQELARFD